MAELLILKRDSWMESLSSEELDKYLAKYPNFAEKYNARERKGDVVEIQEDGFWTKTGRGYDKENFDMVIVKGKTKAELISMSQPLLKLTGEVIDGKTQTTLAKKFRYNISTYTNEGEVSLTEFTEKLF